ncbi:hypothetical protein [Citrobacter werkmanii]|uniref:hypothetical protein n=1 Tax=Citrobacter werkmanii TaxID=67827 RepID=UPI0026506611|nr:hypothetical protein [Citrobacter werkmanii]MDN8559125.1 hypothetical protein [Citrobacter werkmanii]
MFAGDTGLSDEPTGVVKKNGRKKKAAISRYISHWTRQPPESHPSLWQQYAGEDFTGIAIRSHVDALLNSIPESLHEVIQCEESDEWCLVLDKQRLKKKEWGVAREAIAAGIDKPLVLTITDGPESEMTVDTDEGSPANDLVVKDDGYVVKHALSSFIDAIYVHPSAPAGYCEDIKNDLISMGLNETLLIR